MGISCSSLGIENIHICGGTRANRDLASRCQQHRRFLEVVFRPPATHIERNGFDAGFSRCGAWSSSKTEEQRQGHLPYLAIL